MKREVVFPERMEVCQRHPERAEIFWLEQMLIKAGYPYYFNFWEDLRPVFGGEPDGDPESIDWNTYNFLIEIGRPAGAAFPMISIVPALEENRLNLFDMTAADKQQLRPDVCEDHLKLSAEEAMEMIETYFKTAE